MAWSELSKISSTIACDTGLRAEEPEKMTSVSASPRRRLAALSPITQRMASMMLDLPQPFGPTTPVMLVGRCSVVGSTNDLKPASLMVVRRMRWGFQEGRQARGGPRVRGPPKPAPCGRWRGSGAFPRRPRVDRQGVDVGLHQLAERGIYGAMARQRQLPAE